ncbi:uncharacterized protein LOC113859559 [Abrus precatorius]|uniref:Uncharacterized protein LOC113859534 n=1 Tax=Abrus precatorius TaxID=3816 RepID=A0A8B8KVX4_ABRPR|nr:uncharacterized protein LOC113859534 [Abrus precatorius]XP_027348101.1 uncharacterized protein LOC113859559 [Abrus precatorius]
MSLNCLTCGHILERVNSDKEYHNPEIKSHRKVPLQVDRTWSGKLSPPQRLGAAMAKIKAEHHRRTNSAGDIGPKLIRSSGMRRDWSFEELTGQDKGVRCY